MGEKYLSDFLGQFQTQDEFARRMNPFDFAYTLETPAMLRTIDAWVKANIDKLSDLFLSPEHIRTGRRARLPYTIRDSCHNPTHVESDEYRDARSVLRCGRVSRVQVNPRKELLCKDFDILASKPVDIWITLPETEIVNYSGNIAEQVRVFGADPFDVERKCDCIIDNTESQLSLEYTLRRHNLTKNRLKVIYGNDSRTPAVSMVPPNTVVGKEFNGMPVISVHDELVLPYNAAGLAGIVEKWWMQGVPGTSPLFRIEEMSEYAPDSTAPENYRLSRD